MYYVQYFSILFQEWKEAAAPLVPSRHKTEAERLAAVRSGKGPYIYRVRKGTQTVSTWQHGKQLTKEDNA